MLCRGFWFCFRVWVSVMRSPCRGRGGAPRWDITPSQTGDPRVGHTGAQAGRTYGSCHGGRAAWGFTSFSCAPHHAAVQLAHNLIHSTCWLSTFVWNSFFFFLSLFSNRCSAQRKEERWGEAGMDKPERGAVPGDWLSGAPTGSHRWDPRTPSQRVCVCVLPAKATSRELRESS